MNASSTRVRRLGKLLAQRYWVMYGDLLFVDRDHFVLAQIAQQTGNGNAG